MPERKRRKPVKRTAPRGRPSEGTEPEAGKLDRTKWLHEQAVEGVERLATEGGWKAFLDMKSKLHRYSFRNTLLILQQDPDATMVAGYSTWTKKLKRKVLSQKDGGQPLYIFAFHTRWVEEENPETGKLERVKKPGFHPTHCYDIKSTTGPELPPPPKYTSLEGEAPAAMWDGLVGWLAQEGYTVERTPIGGGVKGDTSPDKKIRIDPDGSALEQLAVLFHEAAHVANGHIEDIDLYRTHRGTFEVEAESTAYIVMTAMGLDVGTTSFEYLASWAKADSERLVETADKVCKTADRLLEALAPDLELEEEQEVGEALELEMPFTP